MNRGRLRGWAALGAVILAALAAFAWPDLLAVVILGAAAGAAALAYLWVILHLRDAESEGDEEREASTGELD